MKRLPFADAAERAAAAPELAAHLRTNGLIAYPTETVYGFGCALRAEALATLVDAKRRDAARPFLVLAAHPDHLPGLVWTEPARKLAAAFWPGPLTLVLQAIGPVPDAVVAEDGTVALRVSPHLGVQAILEAAGGPVTSTSANVPGSQPARSADEAAVAAAALDPTAPWLVLDGGTLPASPPSTIVRCVGGVSELIRAGAVPLARLREVVEEIDGGT